MSSETSVPPLPPGYTLDSQAAAPPPLPPGYTLDSQAPAAPTPNDISGEGRDEYGRPLGPLGPAAPPLPGPVAPYAQPPGDTQLTTAQYGQEKALAETANKSGYFALEPSEPGFAHLVWSLGAPFAAIGQTALGERPMPTGVGALEMASPLAGMGDIRFGPPRTSPMMRAYEEQTTALKAARDAAERYGPPEPPPRAPPSTEPPDSTAASGIAKVRGQLGIGQEPPAPSPIPAEAVPPGVPPGTAVPQSLRADAAIDAVSAPRPSFVPQTNVDPLTRQVTPVRVPPGAAGPETVPYATRTAPLMEGFNKAEPPPAAEPPGPQSLGAAASRDMTDPAFLSAKTPTQALNDFVTSVQQTAKDRASPGVKPNTLEDHNVYVEGVARPESARVFDPEVAGNHDIMRDIDKKYEAASNAQEQGIHDILKRKYQVMEGDDNSVGALKEQRRNVSPDALGVFKDERPVNGQPIVDLINEIRDGPTGKSEAVTNTLNRIEKSLYDKNGSLEVLPSQYYGARKNLVEIRDSGPMTKEGAEARTARRELGRVGEVMDRVIGEGSNGYKDVYLPQWAHYSRLIDQQQYLQSKTLGAGKVTGADGNLTWNGMQKLLEQVAIDKRKPGNSRAKSLTEDQLNNMVAIRNELAALKYRNDLAKSNGSPTVKKAAAVAELGSPKTRAAVEALIQLGLAKTTMGVGNMVYSLAIKPGLERRTARKGAERSEAVYSAMRNKLLSTEIPHE